jgi:hypothetical protein
MQSAHQQALIDTGTYFDDLVTRLKLRCDLPTLEMLRSACETHLSDEIKRKRQSIQDIGNVSDWLSMMLSTDYLICLQDDQGKQQKIALHLAKNRQLCNELLQRFRKPTYVAARAHLGIDRHWVILFSSALPSSSEFLDALYAAIQVEDAVSLVDLAHS